MTRYGVEVNRTENIVFVIIANSPEEAQANFLAKGDSIAVRTVHSGNPLDSIVDVFPEYPDPEDTR